MFKGFGGGLRFVDVLAMLEVVEEEERAMGGGRDDLGGACC